MRIALVDDNEIERTASLAQLLEALHNLHIPIHHLEFFSSGEEFLEAYRVGTYDLIILDILMGGMTGVEVAQEIRKQNQDVRIVMCSSSNEYACESYNVNASYYIHKPVTEESVKNMLARLDMVDYELRRFVELPDGQRMVLRNVVFAEYSNHLITIHTKRGDNLKTWMSFSSFVELLEPYEFFLPCNKGSLVNLYEVVECTDSMFVMSNGENVPISRRRKAEAAEAYEDFLFHTLRNEMD